MRKNITSICTWGLIIGVAVTLLFSASLYVFLNLVGQDATEIDGPPVVHAIEEKLKSVMSVRVEYTSALSRCNSDIVITSFPKGTIANSLVNDDFCDCTKGEDELLTAACSDILVGVLTFTCGSAANEVKYLRSGVMKPTTTIFTSRVQDGVCDCEDLVSNIDENCFHSKMRS